MKGKLVPLCVLTLLFISHSKTGVCSQECNTETVDAVLNTSEIACSGMSLKTIPQLRNEERITAVDFSHNEIEELNNVSFIGYVIVEEIKLTGNRIGLIGEETFRNLSFLRDVDLSDNKLYTLNPRAFASCPIQYLSLGGNPLFLFQKDGPIIYSSSLVYLDLSYTLMTRFVVEALSQVPNVATLVLRGNSIDDIPAEEIATVLPNLISADFSKNPLKCTCNVYKFLQFVKNRTEIYSNEDTHEGIECVNNGRINILHPWSDIAEECIENDVSATNITIRENTTNTTSNYRSFNTTLPNTEESNSYKEIVETTTVDEVFMRERNVHFTSMLYLAFVGAFFAVCIITFLIVFVACSPYEIVASSPFEEIQSARLCNRRRRDFHEYCYIDHRN